MSADNRSTVKRLIQQDQVDVTTPNECHPDELPPLHMALEQGDVSIVRMLLAAGADVYVPVLTATCGSSSSGFVRGRADLWLVHMYVR